MLSQLFVLRRSKNFTSNGAIRMPPSVPLNHYLDSENQQNRSEVLFHYSMQQYSSITACFEHSNFFRVNFLAFRSTQLRALRIKPDVGRAQQYTPVSGGPLTTSLRSNYELFNCNNFNIRYWSWNYRGCWHQTCPPLDPR